MKDALGHGSGGSGGVSGFFAKQRSQFGSYTGPDRRGSAEAPVRNAASDQAAANALMMGVKSGVVPVHDSMGGTMSNPTTAPSPQNRRAGDGVAKGQQTMPFRGERTFGQEVNKNLVSRTRFGLRNT